jgi:hypothetical protein
MAKPSGNSKIKTLSPEVQRQLYDACNVGTLAEAAKWLRSEHGTVVSAATLSRWYGWYGATLTFREADAAAEAYTEYLKETISDMTPEELAEQGTKAFLALQIKTGDSKGFKRSLDGLARLRNLKISEAKLQAALDKIEAAKKIVDTPDTAVSTAEKLKQLFARE